MNSFRDILNSVLYFQMELSFSQDPGLSPSWKKSSNEETVLKVQI